MMHEDQSGFKTIDETIDGITFEEAKNGCIRQLKIIAKTNPELAEEIANKYNLSLDNSEA